MRRSLAPARPREHGQAMLETAVIAPLILVMFLGIFNASDMISNQQSAYLATASGARLAAQLGNNGYSGGSGYGGCQSAAKDPCDADIEILNDILPLVTQIQFDTITEIDIYQPTPCAVATYVKGTCPPDDGSFQSATSYGERYSGTGTLLSYGRGSSASMANGYTLDLRNQGHPSETSIAVQITYVYRSPDILSTITFKAYSVARIAPTFS